MVVHVDGTTGEDTLGEEEQGHVGPSPGTIDREKTQSRGRDAEEMTVGMGHHLIRLLGDGIEAYGMIGRLMDGERHLPVQSVYARAAGIHQVPDGMGPAGFEDVHEPEDIAVEVGVRMRQTVTYTRLGGQVDHNIRPFFFEHPEERLPVLQIDTVERIAGIEVADHLPSRPYRHAADARLCQAGILETGIIVVVDLIDAGDRMTAGQQTTHQMEADEAGRAGDQIMQFSFHHQRR